jgi:hypothetical protein
MERITIGSLVKHRLNGAVGLVIKHTMWDADWGAFHVKFNKPAVFGNATCEFLVDRADRWVLVSGCDNQ